MIASLATIFGALAGLVPAIIQFFTLKASNAHAIELKKLELQAAKEGVALQIDLANAQSDIQQQQYIYSFANSPTGIKWVDALSVLVRPYITLVIFHMWVLIEIALFVAAVNGGLDLAQIVPIIWDETSKSILGSVMGFWFGNRFGMRGMQAMAATLSVSPAAAVKPIPMPGIIPAPAGDRP